ncbi:MAG: nucleoside-diphosphate sugar epimerase [Thermomonas sp.]
MADSRTAGRIVALAGASGLVGRCLLERLCADPGVARVHALVRRDLPVAHAKLDAHRVDFAALPALPAVDEVYLALGTTIKAAGSQAAFRAIDFDANLAVALAALAAGAKRCGLVSAMNANARSTLFYNRVKGELEDALAALPFDALVVARPSMLEGDREALGQPARPLERWGARIERVLRPLVPRNLRAIPARDVAATLADTVPIARGHVLVESAAMQGASSRTHPAVHEHGVFPAT